MSYLANILTILQPRQIIHLPYQNAQVLGVINIPRVNEQPQLLIVPLKIHHRINPAVLQSTHIFSILHELLILWLL